MINVYDFDGTIYDGDSSIDFYLYCINRKPNLIKYMPKFITATILYKLRIKEKEYMKEAFFSIVKGIDDIESYIKDFWTIKNKKIKSWYIKQKKDTDIIISASPEFLINYIGNKLGVSEVIATKVNIKTGKLESKNCCSYEKIKRYEQKHSENNVKAFYTDDPKTDMPMLNYAETGYIVNKNTVRRWKND